MIDHPIDEDEYRVRISGETRRKLHEAAHKHGKCIYLEIEYQLDKLAAQAGDLD